jgi:N-acetylgalactosamine-N,N'-diacetylbacillosaminyl-diphospho-undecaprenol 4-alpha-N-acetylgalactosaminyltransferase
VFNKEIDQVYATGGSLHSLDVKGGVTVLQKTVSFFQRLYRVRDLKKKLHIRICLSFLEGADYINILTKANSKTIINIRGSKRHDANITGPLGWLRKKILIPILYNRADVITLVSEGLKDELTTSFAIKEDKPFITIPNFCDQAELLKLAQVNLEQEEQLLSFPTIVTVGRIAYEKGYDLFAKVFSRLIKVVPNVKWIILGSGPFQDNLKSTLETEGLIFSDEGKFNRYSHVWFTGYQQNPYKWVVRCNAFVLSSRTEGFPNALLEAMALGKPVVAADCPYGPADILGRKTGGLYENEFGILLPVLSDDQQVLDAWCEKLNELLCNPQLLVHYSQQSRIRANHYSPERIQGEWIKLIERHV